MVIKIQDKLPIVHEIVVQKDLSITNLYDIIIVPESTRAPQCGNSRLSRNAGARKKKDF